MRKVTAGLFVSLDGVTESPEKCQLPYFNDEMGVAVGAAMAAADAILLGRVTYQEFASFWPGVRSEDQPFADYMNNTPKYVVSTTLEEPLEWNNSTLIKGNVAEEITKLKQQPGKNIGITGSATLVQSLLQDDLLDELDRQRTGLRAARADPRPQKPEQAGRYLGDVWGHARNGNLRVDGGRLLPHPTRRPRASRVEDQGHRDH